MYRHSLFAVVTLICVGSAEAQDDRFILRTLSLADLGFSDGLRIDHLGGTQDIFVPVPRNVQSGRANLHVSYSHAAAFDGYRSFEIFLNDRPLYTKAINALNGKDALDVPIDNLHSKTDSLKITFRYTGAVTEKRCVDLRLTGENFTVLPETAIRLEVKAAALEQSVASVIALMPKAVTIKLSAPETSENELAAALGAARLFSQSGRKVQFSAMTGDERPSLKAGSSVWDKGTVMIASPQQFASLQPAKDFVSDATAERGVVSVVALADGPAIAISGGQPQLMPRYLASAWQGTASSRAISVGELKTGQLDGEELSLTDLNIQPAVIDVIDKSSWRIGLNARDVPEKRRVTGAAFDLVIAPDGGDTKPVVSVFLNDQLLGSAVAETSGAMRLKVPFPDGIFGLENTVRVQVQRQPKGGDCVTIPQAYPAQLLASSSFALSPAATHISDFHQFASLTRSGVTISLPSRNIADLLSILPAVAESIRQLTPADGAISVQFGDAPLSGNFIHFGQDAPQGTVPHVRFDSGGVRLTSTDGRVLLDLTTERPALTAQLLKTESGGHGIWVRPDIHNNGGAATDFKLDRGNVVLVERDGVGLSFSTERDQLIRIAYTDMGSLATFIKEHFVWIIGGVWLAITLLFSLFLGRYYRSRRQSGRA